jgi:hypothetical protein
MSDDELKKRLDETQKLLRAAKANIARAISNGERVRPNDLNAVAKLEVALENLAQYQRLRELTRDEGPPAEAD